MQLLQRLYEQFREKAHEVKVECVSIGLSYTAVTTDDGGIGVAFTYVDNKHCCSLNRYYRDYEGERAIELLTEIKSPDPVHRSMGLALINALNYYEALGFPEDPANRVLLDTFHIGQGTRVAMVGLFRPLMKMFEECGALVDVLDHSQGMGEQSSFYERLSGWADVLLLTSTSILNQSAEDILSHLGAGAKVVMLGPSTPMTGDVFRHLPVHMLAGTVPLNKEGVLRAVRHGAGTPVIHRHSRKVYLKLF